MTALSTAIDRTLRGFFAGRAGPFVVLAFLLAAQNTYASTLVASQFLARVGARGIPLYYILFAATSIPFATLFSSVIDRFPRRLLFVGGLAGFTLLTLAFALLPAAGIVATYGSYLAVRVFEHLLYSVYYILVADYFTVTDNKRHAGALALGMAFGGLVGGVLLTLATSLAGPAAAAWGTPVLVIAAMAFAAVMTRHRRPLDAAAPAARESLFESLSILPQLLRRYPMIALMSAAMFLNILLQCMAEFLAFSIYTAHFPRFAALTVFLGVVNAGLSMLGFAIIIAFTGRQLPRLGVPKMNRVYPALDVVAFAALTAFPSLPTGILANVSYDPFEHGIDVPVTTMNYNAIRHRFVGRVRVFIDGMVFPLGLAAAGCLLMAAAGRLDLRLVAAVGLGLSLVLLVLHWNIGSEYARGLVEMLRDGAVELDQVESGLRLPPDTVGEIRAMLAGDPRTALVGLQMAQRCAAAVPPDEIGSALAKLPAAEARRALDGLAASHDGLVEQLAGAGPAESRRLAAERLLVRAGAAEQARRLLSDGDAAMRAIAAAALLIDDPADAAAATVLRAPLPAEAALGAVEVLAQAPRDMAPSLAALGEHEDPGVRSAALRAAGRSGNEASLLDWARRAAGDPAPEVRQEAAALLVRLEADDGLGALAGKLFDDPAPEVRAAAARALAERGGAAIPVLCRRLHDDREDAQIAAIDALGSALGSTPGPAAADRLYDELRPRLFDPIATELRLARACRIEDPGGPELRAALDNASRRAVRLIMHVLAALGHRRTLNLVRTMLGSRDERGRANAIESIASLPQRRFVIPILPLIEAGETARAAPGGGDPALLGLAAASLCPWLRAAAAVAGYRRSGAVPESLRADPSAIVAETVRQLECGPHGPRSYRQEALMSRLAFLHGVRLFADTSLDDLLAVDHVLGSETYLAGEAIVSEGERGDRLCIVHSGTVAVTKGRRLLAELGPGDFFGEMALFDDEPRSATVTALGDVEVLALPRDRFHSLARQRPGILIELCSTLVRRLRQAEQQQAPAAG